MSKKLPVAGEPFQMALPIPISEKEVLQDAKGLGGNILNVIPEIKSRVKALQDKYKASTGYKKFKAELDTLKAEMSAASTDQHKLANSVLFAQRVAEVEVVKRINADKQVFEIHRAAGGRNSFVKEEPMVLNDLNDPNIIAAKGEAEAEKAHKSDKRKASRKSKAKVTKSKAKPSDDFEDMEPIYSEPGRSTAQAEAE